MNWLFALFFTCLVYAGNYWVYTLILQANARFFSFDTHAVHVFAITFVHLALAVWVGFDARHLGFQKYKGFVSGTPVRLAFTALVLGLLFLVLYLQKRWKITNGEAHLEPAFMPLDDVLEHQTGSD